MDTYVLTGQDLQALRLVWFTLGNLAGCALSALLALHLRVRRRRLERMVRASLAPPTAPAKDPRVDADISDRVRDSNARVRALLQARRADGDACNRRPGVYD